MMKHIRTIPIGTLFMQRLRSTFISHLIISFPYLYIIDRMGCPKKGHIEINLLHTHTTNNRVHMHEKKCDFYRNSINKSHRGPKIGTNHIWPTYFHGINSVYGWMVISIPIIRCAYEWMYEQILCKCSHAVKWQHKCAHTLWTTTGWALSLYFINVIQFGSKRQ